MLQAACWPIWLALLGTALARAPKGVSETFGKATEFELYSLDPSKESKEGFHGWTILGKTSIKGELAQKVRAAIEKGVSENTGTKGGCFNPRHGIRIVREKKVYDMVICFQCQQIYVYEGDKDIDFALTSDSPAELLNKVLTDAKVPLPEQKQ